MLVNPCFTNYKDVIESKLSKTGHVTLTTPLLMDICYHKLGFDAVYLHAKFDDSSFSHSRDINGASKFKVSNVTMTTPL